MFLVCVFDDRSLKKDRFPILLNSYSQEAFVVVVFMVVLFECALNGGHLNTPQDNDALAVLAGEEVRTMCSQLHQL